MLLKSGLEEKSADSLSFLLPIDLDKNGQTDNFYETLNLIKQGGFSQILAFFQNRMHEMQSYYPELDILEIKHDVDNIHINSFFQRKCQLGKQ